MPKGSNQKLKLYYLRKIMLDETDDEHGLTMSEIIDRLREYEVSAERKTLYEDIKALSELGIEVIREQSGREYLYYATGRDFELAEVKLLVDAISASRFISEKKTQNLIKKISSLVSKYEAGSLRRQVYLSGRIKTMNESVYYNVDAVHRAIFEGKRIRFKYCSWSTDKKLVPRYGGKVYEISPWALSYNDECYYMIGYDSDREAVRHYRVDKMLSISVTDKPRDGRDAIEKIEIGTYVTQNFGMCGGEVRRLRIRLPEDKCGIFIDRFGKELNFSHVGEGLVETSVTLAVSTNFYGWLFGLGADVRVVGPPSVVEDIKAFAETVYKSYV